MTDDLNPLDVLKAQVDAYGELTSVATDYAKAVQQVLSMQIANAANVVRLQILIEAKRDFEAAHHAALREIRLQEAHARLLERSMGTASHLLMGWIPNDMRALAWAEFWRLVRLASPGTQHTIMCVRCGDTPLLASLEEDHEVPALGSPKWEALSQVFLHLTHDADERLAALRAQIQVAGERLAELKKTHWAQVGQFALLPVHA